MPIAPLSSAHASLWLQRFSAQLKPKAHILDLACGLGRNSIYLAQLGHQVQAIDINQEALNALQAHKSIHTFCYDLENKPWPYPEQQFDAIVVCRYLHRPLFENIMHSLKPKGLLIYETFMSGNERYGKPSRPAFLLNDNELLHSFMPYGTVLAFEQGLLQETPPAMLQRICLQKY